MSKPAFLPPSGYGREHQLSRGPISLGISHHKLRTRMRIVWTKRLSTAIEATYAGCPTAEPPKATLFTNWDNRDGGRRAGCGNHSPRALERARHEFAPKQTIPLIWPGHAEGSRLLRRKAKAAVIGRVANQQNRPVAERPGLAQCLRHQRGADPAVADVGSDRERAQQQARVASPGYDGPEPEGADKPAALNSDKCQAGGGLAAFSQSLRSEAAPTECSIEQLFACGDVGASLGRTSIRAACLRATKRGVVGTANHITPPAPDRQTPRRGLCIGTVEQVRTGAPDRRAAGREPIPRGRDRARRSAHQVAALPGR